MYWKLLLFSFLITYRDFPICNLRLIPFYMKPIFDRLCLNVRRGTSGPKDMNIDAMLVHTFSIISLTRNNPRPSGRLKNKLALRFFLRIFWWSIKDAKPVLQCKPFIRVRTFPSSTSWPFQCHVIAGLGTPMASHWNTSSSMLGSFAFTSSGPIFNIGARSNQLY